MLPILCPFCGKSSPPDAKFCSACGGALHLAPCPKCGAVNDVTASTCYQCQSPLPGRRTGEADAAPPVAEASQPSPQRRPGAKAAAAALVAIVALGYYGYRQILLVDVPEPAAAETTAVKSEEAPQPASPATLPPEPALADRAPAAENERRADPQPEEARRANADPRPLARPRPGGAGKAGGQAPARQDVCTDAVAALGLCTMRPEDRKLAEDVAAANAAKAGPEAADSGEARAQGPADACTEAVAALGLCAPATTRKQGE